MIKIASQSNARKPASLLVSNSTTFLFHSLFEHVRLNSGKTKKGDMIMFKQLLNRRSRQQVQREQKNGLPRIWKVGGKAINFGA